MVERDSSEDQINKMYKQRYKKKKPLGVCEAFPILHEIKKVNEKGRRVSKRKKNI